MKDAFSTQSSILTQLMAVIESRKADPPEGSYTADLFRGGAAVIGAKIIEEATEIAEAAAEAAGMRRKHVVHEAADLVYHLLVLLGYCDIGLEQLESELRRRFGVSGLDEKASRRRDQ